VIGQILGHYRVLELLGKGGMGEVYRAEDTTLDREVALKILPPELAQNQERLDRFQREAKTLAALDHPNIVTIHTVEEADGVHFLTMQLVEGKPLSQLIPDGGMPLERIFDLAIPLADALASAHEKGVVHRDLKPANAMVSDEGRVKVLDFGLAKLRLEAEVPLASELPTEPLTEEGRIVGTVPYMSPEQLDGKEIDARSDIFSLGVMLYEMATGERPFKGDSTASLMMSIGRDTPPTVDSVNRDLPRHLGRVIAHCLEKDPRRRYQSALDVCNELAALRKEVDSGAEQPVSESPPEPQSLRRGRGWPRVAGTLGLVFLAILGMVWWWSRALSDSQVAAPAASENAIAERKMIIVLPFENLGAPEDTYFADGVTEEITSRLAAVSGLGVISRTTAVQYDRTGKTLKELGADLGLDYVLEGTVRWSHADEGRSRVLITPQLIRVTDDTHLWSDRYDRELEDIFAVQAEVAQQVIGLLEVTLLAPERERLETRPTENMEAYQAYLRGKANVSQSGGFVDQDWALAAIMFERAVQLDPNFALAWVWLSLARGGAIWVGTTEASDANWNAARQAAERALELQPDLPEANYAMGIIHYRVDRQYDLALQRLALARAARPNDVEILTGIGAVNRRRGDWEQALRAWQTAAELDPISSGVQAALGETLLPMHRYPEAEAALARSIALGPDQSGAYLDRWWVRILWTGHLQETRKILESIPLEPPTPYSYWLEYAQLWLERDYEGLLRKVNETDEFRCTDCSSLFRRLYEAAAYRSLGQSDRAQVAYRSAATRLERAAREFPDSAGVHIRLGEAHAGLGRTDEAVQEGLLALELLPVSKDALRGPVIEEALAHIYVMVGETEAALDLLERLLTIPSYVSVKWLRLDPSYDPLRDHPRFQALLEKYGQAAGP
jgi:serine/threonine protein kinase/TolB-like protein/Flp pilus assembly protein TadD